MGHNGRKIRVLVRLALRHEGPVSGAMFVSSHGGRASHPQSVWELLEEFGPFLPFEKSPDGTTVLVSRRNIDWVQVEGEASFDLFHPPPRGLVREELVQVRFQDGGIMVGLMVLDIPDAGKRASDFVNGPGSFFPLVTPEGRFLVNKKAVLDITVFETSPVPDLTLEVVTTAENSASGI
jgi:hypothetical protein